MEALAPRPWTREEYHRASETGLFGPDERLELIDGQIVTVQSPSAPRCTAIPLATEFFRGLARVGTRASDAYKVADVCHVRVRMPLALEPRDEPEPDVMVVRGKRRDYGALPTPEQVAPVVEVGDSTLTRDRRLKVPRYARAGIGELWIVDVEDRRLEIYRKPVADGCGVVTILREEESVAPLFRPDASVVVSELLPGPGAAP